MFILQILLPIGVKKEDQAGHNFVWAFLVVEHYCIILYMQCPSVFVSVWKLFPHPRLSVEVPQLKSIKYRFLALMTEFHEHES